MSVASGEVAEEQERSLTGAMFNVDVPYWEEKKTKGMGQPSQVTEQVLYIIKHEGRNPNTCAH